MTAPRRDQNRLQWACWQLAGRAKGEEHPDLRRALTLSEWLDVVWAMPCFAGAMGSGHRVWDGVRIPVEKPQGASDKRRPRATLEPRPDRRCTEREAAAQGMTIRTPQRQRVHESYLSRYQAGCERCDALELPASLRPARRRYCYRCESVMARELATAGWSRERIQAWLAGADWPASA